LIDLVHSSDPFWLSALLGLGHRLVLDQSDMLMPTEV
jgi:hypothetical protein